MIKVFPTNDAYIDFLTELPISDTEIFCLNFLPVAFFPKDQVKLFFERKEPVKSPNTAADKLWEYGKKMMKGLEKNKVTICLETSSLINMCSKGTIHEATPNYEISFAVRVYVLEKMLKVFDKINLITEPVPFVFRLHAPDEILIDVRRNTSEQQVQGIWLKDKDAFANFVNEFQRLKKSSITSKKKKEFQSEIKEAISSLRQGFNYEWTLKH